MRFSKGFLICTLLGTLLGCGNVVQQVAVKAPTVIADQTKVKPVAITKVVAKMRRGADVGGYEIGAFCLPDSRIRWKSGGKVNLSSEELVDVFRDELERYGWPVVGSTDDLFSGYDISGAELLIAAKITDLESTICYPLIGFGNYDSKGSMRMSVEWQVYNPARKEILGTVITQGSAILNQTMPEADYELMATSFSVAVNNLLASSDFRSMADRSGKLPSDVVSNDTIREIQNTKVLNKSIEEALEKAKLSTVVIRTANGHGSGFAIGRGNYLLTNAHVVGEAKNVTVVTSSQISLTAKVEVVDKGRDIALLSISGISLPALSISNEKLGTASDLYAVGAPLDEMLSSTVTRGMFSSVRQFDGYSWLQSDVAVSPGNSGGPLLNDKGHVVGITAAGFQPAGSQVGLNLFIPIMDGLKFLNVTLVDE